MIFIIAIVLCQFGFTQDEYSEAVLYTIPWGDEPGMLSDDFITINTLEVPEPGPFAVSDNEELVIIDHRINASNPSVSEALIKKFDINGNLTAFRLIKDLNIELYRPWKIAILNSGEIAVSSSCIPQQIFLLDSNLNLMHQTSLPFPKPRLSEFTPTDQGSFWLAFRAKTQINEITYQQYYKTEIFLDGSYSTPEITWDDIANIGLPAHFISPTGEPFLCNADMYDYLYSGLYSISEERTLIKSKLNQQGTEYEIVYTHTSVSDPGWELFETMQNTGPRHFVTWSGDFYTIHATDPGMVLTKYTYQPE